MSDWLARAAPIAEADARDGTAQAALAAANCRPLVLRGLTAHWPLVAAAQQGIAALAQRLASYGQGAPMNVFTAPPGTRGPYF